MVLNATNADGSVDLYFGPEAPKGLENNWVDTTPDTRSRPLRGCLKSPEISTLKVRA